MGPKEELNIDAGKDPMEKKKNIIDAIFLPTKKTTKIRQTKLAKFKKKEDRKEYEFILDLKKYFKSFKKFLLNLTFLKLSVSI